MNILKFDFVADVSGESDNSLRLDIYLAKNNEQQLSRSNIAKLIKMGNVLVDGAVITDCNYKLSNNCTIEVSLPMPVEAKPKAQDIALDIIYEDSDIIVINKPIGMVVHPGSGNPDGTLVNALLYHCGDSLSGINGVVRPGIVHRLDKDTSGLIVVAKNDIAHQHLSTQFGQSGAKTLYRVYETLAWGIISPQRGKIEGNISRHPRNRQKMCVSVSGGKNALTEYKLLECLKGIVSHIQCRLHTGRTHQIRVHLHHKGFPVLGDPVYGNIPRQYKLDCFKELFDFLREEPGQLLHAKTLKFYHPKDNKLMDFTAPLPFKFLKVLDFLKK